MSNNPKLSRRDWFRLRLPHQDKFLGEARTFGAASTNDRSSGLRSIEHPTNHDGMDLDDLPPLREAILTDEDVVALLTDIQRHGSEIQLMQKRSATNSRATVDSATLDTAKTLFLNGNIHRLQIRYQWQNSLWIDTLARQQAGTRLVRVSHQSQKRAGT